MKLIYLTNRNVRVIHIYNGESVTKVFNDRLGNVRIVTAPETGINKQICSSACKGLLVGRIY